jgi:hypothetical protein
VFTRDVSGRIARVRSIDFVRSTAFERSIVTVPGRRPFSSAVVSLTPPGAVLVSLAEAMTSAGGPVR